MGSGGGGGESGLLVGGLRRNLGMGGMVLCLWLL